MVARKERRNAKEYLQKRSKVYFDGITENWISSSRNLFDYLFTRPLIFPETTNLLTISNTGKASAKRITKPNVNSGTDETGDVVVVVILEELDVIVEVVRLVLLLFVLMLLDVL